MVITEIDLILLFWVFRKDERIYVFQIQIQQSYFKI